MRSVDFELFSAIGGMCFFIILLLRALSVLSSRYLKQKSHQPSQKSGVSVLLWHIHPTSGSKVIRERALENCSRCSLLQIVSAHCTTLRCETHMCLRCICPSASDQEENGPSCPKTGQRPTFPSWFFCSAAIACFMVCSVCICDAYKLLFPEYWKHFLYVF